MQVSTSVEFEYNEVMSFFSKVPFLAVILLFSSLSLPSSAWAAREFDINSKSFYSVGPDGKTTVKHEIGLTNKFADIYPTHYALSVGSTRVSGAWARDGQGFLTPGSSTNENSTNIDFVFQEKSVGLGQTLSFSLGYQDEDIAQQNGRIWEVNIPRPEDITEFTNYQVVLLVPEEFHEPVQMNPQPSRTTKQKGVLGFEFDKELLQQRGVTAIFGDTQVMSFDLRYSIENPSPIGKLAKVALPPDTTYQRMIYNQITPKPQNVEIDEDGNWLASFKVEGGKSLEIHAIGFVILTLVPQQTAEPGKPDQNYLKSDLPWQVDDPTIQDLAQKLKTPENIYNYVVSTLTYNYDRVQAGNVRLGAVGVLSNPDQAICTEFTDLFVALARAAGIPARELNGFAYTQNSKLRPVSLKQDILHAWPEYYDQERGIWIPVDPTWGNTTQGIDYFSRFDLNHVVFVIHGKSAQFPYPAGFYKISQTEGKDINIMPSTLDPEIRGEIEVVFDLPNEIPTAINQNGKIIVKSIGNTAVPQTELKLTSPDFDILTKSTVPLQTLLPYSVHEIPVKIKAKKWFTQSQGALTVSVAGQRYEQKLNIKPIYNEIPALALALGLGTGLAFASLRTRNLFLSFRKKRGSLHRQIG